MAKSTEEWSAEGADGVYDGQLDVAAYPDGVHFEIEQTQDAGGWNAEFTCKCFLQREKVAELRDLLNRFLDDG
jgi:hypothetical protein